MLPAEQIGKVSMYVSGVCDRAVPIVSGAEARGYSFVGFSGRVLAAIWIYAASTLLLSGRFPPARRGADRGARALDITFTCFEHAHPPLPSRGAAEATRFAVRQWGYG